jgi:hypothetical protein
MGFPAEVKRGGVQRNGFVIPAAYEFKTSTLDTFAATRQGSNRIAKRYISLRAERRPCGTVPDQKFNFLNNRSGTARTTAIMIRHFPGT